MTATIKPIRVAITPEFPDGIGYEVSRILPNWASAQAGASALSNVNPDAFAPYTPGLCAGEPLDPPEEPWPSDATARTYPPNCDGPPSGYAEPSVGEVLAQAQHVAAEEGEGCTSTVCAMTRGSGD